MSTYRKQSWLAIASMVALLGIGCGDDGETTTDSGIDSGVIDGSTEDGGTDAATEEGAVEETAEVLATLDGSEATGSNEATCRIAEEDITFTDPATEPTINCLTQADVTLLSDDGSINFDDAGVTCVDANITDDTTWSCDQVYVLRSAVYVQGATLSVEPGTVVIGASGDQVVSSDPTSALIVETTGAIDARGTATSPITFTSVPAWDNDDATEPAPGDWGGMVLLGLATINVDGGTNNVEGLAANDGTTYGGDDDTHDCGTLRYVRVMWVGYEFSTNNELNGITVAGCGSDTEMAFVQVHGGDDDGVEFFGGVVNAHHIVISEVNDDSFDTDEGFRGSIQFGIAQQGTNVGNRTVEADNNGGAEDATPRSAPMFVNMTFVGADSAEQQALRLRAGTAGGVMNSYITGFSEEDCVRVDGSVSVGQANSGDLVLNNNVIRGCRTRTIDGTEAVSHFRYTADEGDSTTLFTGDWTTDNYASATELLTDPQNETAPDFTPTAADSALNGAAGTPGTGFNTAATFVGAIEPPSTAGDCWDWTADWTAFPALPAE